MPMRVADIGYCGEKVKRMHRGQSTPVQLKQMYSQQIFNLNCKVNSGKSVVNWCSIGKYFVCKLNRGKCVLNWCSVGKYSCLRFY
jgi:hypothetical protein